MVAISWSVRWAIHCFAIAYQVEAAPVNSYPGSFQLPSVLGNSFGIPGINATYDYVIVGGGTAGLAIAARLAQNYSVAVIEAGGFYEIDNGNGTIIPGLCTQQGVALSGLSLPLIDWGFQTVPQIGLLNQTLNYARGKTLGGSSARNFLAYHRPTVGSMQQWADDVDDQSYTWQNVTPYFDRSVTITLPNVADRYANSSIDFDDSAILSAADQGPLSVTWPNFAASVYSWFYQAFNTIGIVSNTQAFLAGIVDGISWTASTMTSVSQQRSTSQTSYMYQAMLETDIKVYSRSLAKQILFDGNNSATGVRVDTAGQSFNLYAKREVILSGGAFQSPQMLMVSGIGPSSTLEALNIRVRKNLPGVGQNLWDHVYIATTYPVNIETSLELVNNAAYRQQATDDYLKNQTGILTAPPGMLAWERLTNRSIANVSISSSTAQALTQFPSDWPEVEYLLIDGGLSRLPADGRNYASIGIAIVAPLSRGNVTIKTSDTADPPLIDPNWLSNPGDVEMLINGYRRAETAWEQLPNLTAGEQLFPGPNITTDEELEHYIRQTAGSVWHAAATCKMGRSDDIMAVVDSKCRVYGTQRLRVVDASAFPFLTPGHPQSVVYMLAEKIADDILNGY